MHFLSVYLAILTSLWFSTGECKEVCDLNNDKCTTPMGNETYHEFVYAEGLVPAQIPDFNTETPDFKFELSNVKLYNLQNCDNILASYNVPDSEFVYILFCPALVMKTNHTFTGKIGNITFEDETGSFTISSGKLVIIIRAKYSLSKEDEDRKTFMTIDQYKLGITPVEKFKFEQTVLNQGDEQKAKDAMDYLNGEGYEITNYLGIRWMAEGMHKVMNATQIYLSKIPLEEKFSKQ